MILILGGTSTSGKSSISKELVSHGFVIVSLDEVFEETRPDLRYNLYSGDLDRCQHDRKEVVKRIKIEHKKGNNVVVDESYPKLLLPFLEGYPITTCLIYTPLRKLVDNYNSRKHKDYRSMRCVLLQFASMYRKSMTTKQLDSVVGREIYSAACCDKPSFTDKLEMTEFVRKIVDDIGIEKKRTPIVPRDSFDLIIFNDGLIDKCVKNIISYFSEKENYVSPDKN